MNRVFQNLYQRDQETAEPGEKLWVIEGVIQETFQYICCPLPKEEMAEEIEVFRKFLKNNIHSFWLGL